MSDSLPKGGFRRSGILGRAGVRIGLNEVRHRGSRILPGHPKEDEDRDDLEQKNARILFDAFTQLRGTALKISQLLSMELEIFPETWQKELARSYHQVPPLNRALVRKVFRNELNASPEEVFASFNPCAFAAASLGQVHEAELKTGQQVAVKIQYPGIAESIDDDLRLVRGIVKVMPQKQFLLPALAEIEDRLREEVDYHLEASRMQWFAKHLHLDQVQVPEVFPEQGTDRILVMERAQGLHLDDWLATNPSSEQRNHFAQLLYDVFMAGMFELGRLHADPHPGNFFFQPDGQLVLLDFGCVKELEPEFATIFRELMLAFVQENEQSVLDCYVRLGMLDDPEKPAARKFYQEVLVPFGHWVSRPVLEPEFTFATDGGYLAEGRSFMQKFLGQKTMHALCQDFVFTDRTYYGLVRLFEKLGATVRMRHHWLEA